MSGGPEFVRLCRPSLSIVRPESSIVAGFLVASKTRVSGVSQCSPVRQSAFAGRCIGDLSPRERVYRCGTRSSSDRPVQCPVIASGL